MTCISSVTSCGGELDVDIGEVWEDLGRFEGREEVKREDMREVGEESVRSQKQGD